MNYSGLYFLNGTANNPIMLLTVLLTLCVVFVNGWTDAPNAIATSVSTGCLNMRRAVIMSAFFNFLGVFVMAKINTSVSATISNIADFEGNTENSLLALCAAMLATVVYSGTASYFGIPTSESHSLIAGLAGAALAIKNSFACINLNEWLKVVYGLILSLALGFALGLITSKLTNQILSVINKNKANDFFTKAQIFGAAAMSFMHGAQDGQKFIGVLFLSSALSLGQTTVNITETPLWIMLLCSTVMALGTGVGGGKIIKKIGSDMVKIEKHQGFSADLGAAVCLLISSLSGFPVSTTHTKTAAIMGAGAAANFATLNLKVVKEMLLAWVLTFPGCGIFSFIFTKLFTLIF